LAKNPWKACCELLAIAYPFPVAGFPIRQLREYGKYWIKVKAECDKNATQGFEAAIQLATAVSTF
jgi:hypothetical protein